MHLLLCWVLTSKTSKNSSASKKLLCDLGINHNQSHYKIVLRIKPSVIWFIISLLFYRFIAIFTKKKHCLEPGFDLQFCWFQALDKFKSFETSNKYLSACNITMLHSCTKRGSNLKTFSHTKSIYFQSTHAWGNSKLRILK